MHLKKYTFLNFLEQALLRKRNLVIIEDINIYISVDTLKSKNYPDQIIAKRYNIANVINMPTRINNTSNTHAERDWSRHHKLMKLNLQEDPISDHKIMTTYTTIRIFLFI